LLKGLYGLAQRAVACYPRPYLMVAIDPVNFEKPYTEALEGVSTVLKSTPPGPKGAKRLTPGYPAITATIVNLPEPVITYANWFSYRTADFVSENCEIYRALRISRALFPGIPLRFVGDSGLDDQKIFAQVARVDGQFIFRVKHEDRLVEVYNERLQRWEGPEHLNELAASVPWTLRLQVAFHHAHKTRRVTVSLGWLPLRLPDTQQRRWSLVAYDPDYRRQMILLTNVPLTAPEVAEQVYTRWRCGPASSTPTASIKNRASTSKTCASKPWNACTASLCWCYSPRSLSNTSPRRGRTKPSSGYAAWGASSA
jgi:hypothetical protein